MATHIPDVAAWGSWALAEGATFLAQNGVETTGPEFGKAPPVAAAIIVLLAIGLFLLIRSMNKHLARLPETFEREHPEPDQAVDEGTDRAAVETDTSQ
ncbi:hypothetical protein [Lolliginicoccus lacisalsi]|uniref:hypothetical protein n=1 Tax=Lolliginicoccus lacisalsi TaxID=2742202 RepID=UPI0038CC039E